jgi:hypothetical protein
MEYLEIFRERMNMRHAAAETFGRAFKINIKEAGLP